MNFYGEFPGNPNMIMPNNGNMSNNYFNYMNNIINKFNEFDNRIKRLEQRISRLENEGNNSYSYNEPDNTLYMI